MSLELEERFFDFAKSVRNFCRKVKWDLINAGYVKQVIRSSSSIGANYIEASDDLGRADEKMKLKIARREAKETIYWLRLILLYDNPEMELEKDTLIDEGSQIRRILSTILIRLNG
ncbi:MAG: four helix bundle protein [Bacteroidetes bacterium]|nr:four helix bundle protein [Bacteroidota bacterium]